MNYRKITLTVAAAALALPAALATASTAASADGIIPSINVQGIVPTPCKDPTIRTVCDTANNTHAATFTGTYYAKNNSFNDTDDKAHPGTCVDGSSVAGEKTCRVWFFGGNPSTLCNPSPTTPWYQAPQFGKAWEYTPDQAASGYTISGDRLFAEGGGVVDASGVTSSPTGDIVIYRLHIQINAICGNEDTAQALTDNITANAGLGSGALDLSKTYKFSGYFDIG
jgi:hypothetical protein